MLRFVNPNPNVASGTVLKNTRAFEAPKSTSLSLPKAEQAQLSQTY